MNEPTGSLTTVRADGTARPFLRGGGFNAGLFNFSSGLGLDLGKSWEFAPTASVIDPEAAGALGHFGQPGGDSDEGVLSFSTAFVPSLRLYVNSILVSSQTVTLVRLTLFTRATLRAGSFDVYSLVELGTGTALRVESTAVLRSNGTLFTNSSASITGLGQFVNFGNVRAESSWLESSGDIVVRITNYGNFSASNWRFYNFDQKTGDIRLGFPASETGATEPSVLAASARLIGPFTAGATTTTHFRVFGKSNGEYDWITSFEPAVCEWGGILAIRFESLPGHSYALGSGDTFDILRYQPESVCSGNFSSIAAEGLPNGLGVKLTWREGAEAPTSQSFFATVEVCSSGSGGCGLVGPRNAAAPPRASPVSSPPPNARTVPQIGGLPQADGLGGPAQVAAGPTTRTISSAQCHCDLISDTNLAVFAILILLF